MADTDDTRRKDYLTEQLRPYVESCMDATIGRYQVVASNPHPRSFAEFLPMCYADVEAIIRQVLRVDFSSEEKDSATAEGATDPVLEIHHLRNHLNTCKASEMYLRSIAVDMIKDVNDRGAEIAMLKGLIQRRDALLKEQRIAYLREMLHLREIIRQYRSNGGCDLADVMFHAWDQDQAAQQQAEEQNARIDAAMTEIKIKHDQEKEQLESRHMQVIEDLRRQIAQLDIQVQQLNSASNVPCSDIATQTARLPAQEGGTQTEDAKLSGEPQVSRPEATKASEQRIPEHVVMRCSQCGFAGEGVPLGITIKRESDTPPGTGPVVSDSSPSICEDSNSPPLSSVATPNELRDVTRMPIDSAAPQVILKQPVRPASAKRPASAAKNRRAATEKSTLATDQSSPNALTSSPLNSFDGGVAAAFGAQEQLRGDLEAENAKLKNEIGVFRRQLTGLRKSIAEKEAECAQLRTTSHDTEEVRLRQEESIAVRKLNTELREKELVLQAKTEELQQLQDETARWFSNYRQSQPKDQAPINFATVRNLSAAVLAAEAAEEEYRNRSWKLISYASRRQALLQTEAAECKSMEDNYPAQHQAEELADKLEAYTRQQLLKIRQRRSAAKQEANRRWDTVLYHARSMAHGETALEPPPYYATAEEATPGSGLSERQSEPKLKEVLSQFKELPGKNRPTSAPSSLTAAAARRKFGTRLEAAIADVDPREKHLGAADPFAHRRRLPKTASRHAPVSIRNRESRIQREQLVALMRRDQLQLAEERSREARVAYEQRGSIGTKLQHEDVACGIYKWRVLGRCEKSSS